MLEQMNCKLYEDGGDEEKAGDEQKAREREMPSDYNISLTTKPIEVSFNSPWMSPQVFLTNPKSGVIGPERWTGLI